MIGATFASGRNKKHDIEEIIGSVIAFDEIQANWIPCYDSLCEGSLIVRIQESQGSDLVYIRVKLKYPAGKFPKELIKSRRAWRLRLERPQPVEDKIYEYLIQNASSYGPEKKWPIWRIIPGAEQEKLPFEQTVSSYTLVKGGFKLVK